MLKRTLVLLLAFIMLFCTGCGANKDGADGTGEDAVKEPLTVNSLTGLKDVSDDKLEVRPVGVMVENSNAVQGVQAGLADADIVYETVVEGGITRIMAVYKDIEAVKQIGPIRSARYVYVDLALGHDAVYTHAGADPIYCEPRLSSSKKAYDGKKIDDIDLLKSGGYSERIGNGLSSEHTLYGYGDKLWGGIAKNFENVDTQESTWVSFADGDVALSGGAATSISIPFSSSYVTKFAYNTETGTYDRLVKGAVQKDYATEETVSVENVFVLLTDTEDYPDGEHRNVHLIGGDGYYFANGTYTFIKWTKGAEPTSSLAFTDTEGNELKVNTGNSWVCIADKQNCNPTYQ